MRLINLFIRVIKLFFSEKTFSWATEPSAPVVGRFQRHHGHGRRPHRHRRPPAPPRYHVAVGPAVRKVPQRRDLPKIPYSIRVVVDQPRKRKRGIQTSRLFWLTSGCLDLRRHNPNDVDFFLCFLYGHVKKEDFSKANIGALSVMALDCGLFKLHQVVEQITRENVLAGDPAAVMVFAASADIFWLHVAAFD